LVKYDSSGNILWANSPRCLSGGLWSVCTDATGVIYLAGVFSSNTISYGGITLVNDSLGGYIGDICLIKHDPSGAVIWMKKAHDKANDYLSGLACDLMGNINITGYYTGDSIRFGTQLLVADSPGLHYGNMFLTKYEASGIALWARGSSPSISGSNGIAIDGGGNAYITGRNSVFPTVFGTDTVHTAGVFVVKYDGAGSSIWAFGDSLPTTYVTSIAVDGSNSVYLTGSFSASECILGTDTLYRSTGGVTDLFVAKLSYPTLGTQAANLAQENDINIFPVPNDGSMNICFKGSGYESVTIRDAIGRVVYYSNLDATATDLKKTINLGRVASGIYVLTALVRDGIVSRRILVIQE
jgi:hypothetical protein